MAKIIKRIQLNSIPITDLSETATPDNPSTDPSIPALPLIAPEFSFEKSSLPGYGTPLPVTDIDFSFPAEDQKRVQAWFTGDFSHVTLPETATLKKNMTAAVLSTLNSFISSAINRNLFTAPCMIGFRYRLFDNSLIYPTPPSLLIPTEKSPDLIITSYKVFEKSLHTEVTISHYPGALMLSIPSPEKGEEYKNIITSVEFFLTRPVELYPADAKVSGIRSVSIDDIRQRVWYYDSYEPEALTARAKSDTGFRLIASLPFTDIVAGTYAAVVPFPLEAGTLQRFSSLPKVTYPSGSGNNSGATGSAGGSAASSNASTGISGWRPYLHIATSPLDLGLPETSKSVSDLFLRGIFQRDEVTMTLYGSHHREHWRMIARSRGPYIRGIRRAPYRWLKVEIELPMRRDDFLDTLTFIFA